MRESITIQGLDFPVQSPYAEGHVLTKEEAGVLNQTFHENLRNNFASTVKSYKDEHGDELPKSAMDELLGEFEKYAEGYQFGVRRGGYRLPADPVEAEAIRMAKESIRQKLRELGRKADASAISEAAVKVLASEKGQAYRDAAKRRVAEAQKVAAESLEDIVSDITSPEAQAA